MLFELRVFDSELLNEWIFKENYNSEGRLVKGDVVVTEDGEYYLVQQVIFDRAVNYALIVPAAERYPGIR